MENVLLFAQSNLNKLKIKIIKIFYFLFLIEIVNSVILLIIFCFANSVLMGKIKANMSINI
jgi:hypothetical protein